MKRNSSIDTWRSESRDNRKSLKEQAEELRATSSETDKSVDDQTAHEFRFRKLENVIASLAEKAKELQKNGQGLQDKFDRLDQAIQSEKLQAIQILAIFVAFFTFVSVQFQLFASVKDGLMTIALSMLLLSSLLIFVSLVFLGVDYFRKQDADFAAWMRNTKDSFKGLWLLAVILAVAGIILASHAHSAALDRRAAQERSCSQLGERIESSIRDKTDNLTDFLKKRYDNECKDIWAS
ncbi:MAG TPA: hypothetical protein VFK47_18895 [Ktedonobacteraceae bacterium]|nr:hypothetical protein [Ktedonobacteraceae bacterium]